MKPRGFLFALAMLPLHAAAQDLSTAANKLCETSTRAMLGALETADFDAAVAKFSPELRDRMGAQALQQAWQALPAKVGALRTVGRFHAGQIGGHPEIFIPLIHERGTVTGDVACAKDGTITEFSLKLPRG